MQIQKRHLISLSLASTVGVAVLFQNCSQVHLENALSNNYEAPQLSLKNLVCPSIRLSAGSSSKYVFMIDMSASNIGDWDKDPPPPTGGPPLAYWDATKATDPNGERFKAVQHFLENCSGQSGIQFAVIGFSKTAGILTGSGATAALSCANVNFVSAATANQNLKTLQDVQKAETPWFLQWQRSTGKYLTDPNFPPISSVTSYISALNCAEKVVVDDLTAAGVNSTQTYHVFFISDGVPADVKNTGCNVNTMTAAQSSTCHLEGSLTATAYMRQAAMAKAKDLRIYGIYYGSSPTVPMHMDAIAMDGGTGGGMKLTSFQGNQNALCNIIVTQFATDYKPDVLSAMNLTSLRRGGRLLADSDMDGVPDEDEVKLGLDPTNPRSSGVDGVLDGICVRLGGIDACKTKRASITCNSSIYNSMGLTNCDFKMLDLDKLPGVLEWGIDSDHDGVPDFIEIIKGTNPALADMTADPDGDGVSNLEELQKGSDPFTADTELASTVLNNFQVNSVPQSQNPTCNGDGWSIDLNRLQAIKTKTVAASGSLLADWAHTKNQQVLFVYYRLTPQNSNSPITEYYGKFVKVDFTRTGDTESLGVTTTQSEGNDFRLMGKAAP